MPQLALTQSSVCLLSCVRKIIFFQVFAHLVGIFGAISIAVVTSTARIVYRSIMVFFHIN